jgi:hypothetical protein
LGICKNQ